MGVVRISESLQTMERRAEQVGRLHGEGVYRFFVHCRDESGETIGVAVECLSHRAHDAMGEVGRYAPAECYDLAVLDEHGRIIEGDAWGARAEDEDEYGTCGKCLERVPEEELEDCPCGAESLCEDCMGG